MNLIEMTKTKIKLKWIAFKKWLTGFKISDGISILSLLVSLAGFIWVVKTLQSSDDTASTDTYLKTYEWTLDIDKAFIEKPQLKRYLDGDTTSSDGNNYNKQVTEAFAEYMLDSYDAVLNNTSYFKSHKDVQDQWLTTVASTFSKYCVMRKVYVKDSLLYGYQLKAAYHKG